MEESEEIDVGEFGQELTEASECQLKYRKVVHLADVELTKISLGSEVNQPVAQAAEVKAITTESDDSIVVSESLQSVEQQTTTSPTVTVTQPKNVSVRVKLSKLEVNKFRGSFFEWQEFWDAFQSAIDKNDGLSDVDKFSYLWGSWKSQRSLLLVDFL